MNSISVVGITLSVFLGTALLLKKNAKLQDKILTVWLSIIGITMMLLILENYNIQNSFPFPFIFIFRAPLELLQGSLLYFYVFYGISNKQNFKLGNYLHFIPSIIVLIVITCAFFLREEEASVFFGQIHKHWLHITISLVISLNIPMYSILSLLLIKKHKKLFREKNEHNIINLKWFGFVTLHSLIISLLIIITVIVKQNIKGISIEVLENTIYFLVTAFVFIVGVYGIKKTYIFKDDSPRLKIEKKVESVIIDKSKRNNDIHNQNLIHEYAKLINVLNQKKLYLKSNLTLSELSTYLGTNNRYLSQAINKNSKMNFFKLINSFRIEEFKKKIKDKNYSAENLISIAYECGFSSKTSFNRAFKKTTGSTPSEYRKKIMTKTP